MKSKIKVLFWVILKDSYKQKTSIKLLSFPLSFLPNILLTILQTMLEKEAAFPVDPSGYWKMQIEFLTDLVSLDEPLGEQSNTCFS